MYQDLVNEMLIHAQAASRVINTTWKREHQLACLSETISVRQRRSSDAYPDVNSPDITFYRSLLLIFFGFEILSLFRLFSVSGRSVSQSWFDDNDGSVEIKLW